MINPSILTNRQIELIHYLIQKSNHSNKDLPPINQISQDLGISPANLREQIELLKNIGAISIKPRKGLHLLDYQFSPAVTKSLYYAVQLDSDFFSQFSEVRNQLEKVYFIQSAQLLDEQAIDLLKKCVISARQKLTSNPIQIPHPEHKNFHLCIYKPIKNVFLTGMLEAYWKTYEMVGLHVYSDLNYLEKVWDYHEDIVNQIIVKDFQRGLEQLTAHMELISTR